MVDFGFGENKNRLVRFANIIDLFNQLIRGEIAKFYFRVFPKSIAIRQMSERKTREVKSVELEHMDDVHTP